jgi:hypothetical protein
MTPVKKGKETSVARSDYVRDTTTKRERTGTEKSLQKPVRGRPGKSPVYVKFNEPGSSEGKPGKA